MQDALDEIARQKPRDVFKPLRVHYIGEDGIDAGGVKKEFFQLLVTELLCPDYGMLIFQSVRPASRVGSLSAACSSNLWGCLLTHMNVSVLTCHTYSYASPS